VKDDKRAVVLWADFEKETVGSIFIRSDTWKDLEERTKKIVAMKMQQRPDAVFTVLDNKKTKRD